jgi:hypothetical protein
MIVVLLSENIKIMDTTKEYLIKALNCELHPTSKEHFLHQLQMSSPTI